MEFFTNPGKQVRIEYNGQAFDRHAIQTHFINIGENYIDLVRTYVAPFYQEGDLLSISEKVIALCQRRVVYKADVKPGILARVLCRFVAQTPAGPGAGNPYKMQFAISQCGHFRVLWAAFRAAIDKLRGIRGTFYRLTGQEVSGLDGFYGFEFPEYGEYGIRIPDRPNFVCDEIHAATGIPSMITDANDLDVVIFGKASVLPFDTETLEGMVRDNPAGQSAEQTPFILIRPVAAGAAPETDASEVAQAEESQAEAAEAASVPPDQKEVL